jgi:hypothetical protein
MKNESLDPRIEKLIAMLYGELPEPEAQILRRDLEQDPALRAEWEELNGARSFLGAWEMPEESPGFVFVTDPTKVTEANAAPRRRAGFLDRIRSLVPAWSWGLAATATAVLVLAVNGFRIDKVDGGIAFRFGHENAKTPAIAESLAPDGVRGVPLTSPPSGRVASEPVANEPVSTAPSMDARSATPQNAYLTKEEFQAYTAGMTQTMVALLNEYGHQRDQEVSSALQIVLKNVTEKQTEDYRDLRGRFDAFATGLGQEQMTTRAQLGYLLEQTRSTSPGSVHPSPAIETKGDQK